MSDIDKIHAFWNSVTTLDMLTEGLESMTKQQRRDVFSFAVGSDWSRQQDRGRLTVSQDIFLRRLEKRFRLPDDEEMEE